MEVPVISVSGNSYEIGFQHGSKAKSNIDVVISLYKKMFKEFANISWQNAKKIALKFEKNIYEYNPEYLDEIKGIADGSGYEYEEILAINVRSEIVFQEGNFLSDGCTSIVVTSDRTTSTTYLAQNWDWKLGIVGGVILLKINKEGKAKISTITEAGIIGKIGCNANGIGVCFNALSVDGKPSGVPIHIILRSILEQSTFKEALNVVGSTKIACPGNILIASHYGEALDFEIDIDDFDALYPEDGTITHTNHFTSIRMPKNGRKDIGKCKFPDTFIRKGRADKIIKDIKGNISFNDIKSVLTNNTDPSASIYQHDKSDLCNDDSIGTIFSIIMNLKLRELYISFGKLYEYEFIKYNM